MSPRSYNLGKRKASAQETRTRIIEAARRVLEAPEGVAAFTIDAVAREAGVSRMTLYHQFGSKTGLLDGLYDDLAARGLLPYLPAVMHTEDAVRAFDALVEAFCRFWATDRIITRRVRALAAIDPEVDRGIRERDGWRRGLFENALLRLAGAGYVPEEAALGEMTDIVLAVTSFAFFDQLAETHNEDDCAAIVLQLARSLWLSGDGASLRTYHGSRD
jgi:AcrR family transcriptional regulator